MLNSRIVIGLVERWKMLAGVVFTALAGFFVWSRFVREKDEDKFYSEKKKDSLPYETGHYQSIADQLTNLFRIPFMTDEDGIWDLVKDLSPDEVKEVYKLFGRRFGSWVVKGKLTLVEHLKDELEDSPEWYEKVGAIFEPASVGW